MEVHVSMHTLKKNHFNNLREKDNTFQFVFQRVRTRVSYFPVNTRIVEYRSDYRKYLPGQVIRIRL